MLPDLVANIQENTILAQQSVIRELRLIVDTQRAEIERYKGPIARMEGVDHTRVTELESELRAERAKVNYLSGKCELLERNLSEKRATEDSIDNLTERNRSLERDLARITQSYQSVKEKLESLVGELQQ